MQTNVNNTLCDPQQWPELYGDSLLRYAFARCRNHEIAEELVQETFLAALAGREKFTGLSSEKTWLFAILKHKIIDHYRKQEKERAVAVDEEQQSPFRANGHWQDIPQKWNINPGYLFEQKEFWEVLSHCLHELPEEYARVFILRILEELSSEEICKTLEISTANLWVRLHRARLKMRECLERCWFTEGNN